MTNVVIDMNNMLFRSLHVLGGFGQKSYTFDSQKELDELMRKLAMDMSFLIRMINPSRVIFAVDDKSWRKGINIEENEGYKAQRKLSNNINWDNIFMILDKFMEIVEEIGMIVTKIPKAEGDDVIALWSDELLYNQKQHVIIISGDEDVRQLVKSHIDDNNKQIFCTVFNPFMQGKNAARKLYVPENEFNIWLNKEEEVSIWNMDVSIDIDKGDFCRIRDTEKVRVEEVDGNMIAMKKVFCGDDGDNIPAIFTWIAKEKDGTPKMTSDNIPKEVRITNAPFLKIFEQLKNFPGEKIDHNILKERSKKILQGLTKVAKESPAFNINERLERQIKLVVLDKTLFPSSILEKFEEIKQEPLLKPRPEIGSMNMNVMLAGTRYVKTKQGGTHKGNEADIFKKIDQITNKSLF